MGGLLAFARGPQIPMTFLSLVPWKPWALDILPSLTLAVNRTSSFFTVRGVPFCSVFSAREVRSFPTKEFCYYLVQLIG